jgi:hypothetical protein
MNEPAIRKQVKQHWKKDQSGVLTQNRRAVRGKRVCQMEANGGVGDGNSFAPPGLLASIGAIRVFRRGLSQLIL